MKNAAIDRLEKAVFSYLRKKLFLPLLDFLKQGITPEKLALSVVIGALMGIFPIIGTTTAICAIVAFALRLNMAAIQLINYFAYPLQIMLLIPFFTLGNRLFGGETAGFSLESLIAMFNADFFATVQNLWQTLLHGALMWAIVAVPLSLLMYFPLVALFRKFVPSEEKAG